MALSQLTSYALVGMEAAPVTVETHLGPGLPAFQVVGLPEATVREARDRVRSAICNSGFSFPQQRITVNLAPADLPKHGGRFDLAMALGILVASQQVPAPQSSCAFLGELALCGAVRGVHGVISAALRARQDGRQLVMASANADEAALCDQADHRHCHSLAQASAWLAGHEALPTIPDSGAEPTAMEDGPCLSQVRGQLLDRLDMRLDVAPLDARALLGAGAGEDSATVRERVAKARQQQAERQGVINARLPRAAFNTTISQHQAWLVTAMDRLGLSARALVRLLRVSRTLADLAGSPRISQDHLEEALLFRQDGVAGDGQSSPSARR